MDINQELYQLQLQQQAFNKRLELILLKLKELESIPLIENSTPTTLSIRQVAKASGLHRNTVKKDIDNGVLKVVHRGGRERVTAQSADQYINPKS